MQITIPTGLFNLGGFTLPQTPVAPAPAAPSPVDLRVAEIEAEVERKRQEEEASRAVPEPADISVYYDALRAGEDPSEFADILQSSLADQGYITTGFERAEAGAYGPVEDLFIVPGGLGGEVGEFEFDKTLEDFKGYDFDYGSISNENLKKFQEELLPVMAPEVAQAQLEGQSYQNALIQAYERSPQVQEIYAKYDISPQRISRNNASEYVYDPFTFGEIQTVDRSKGFMDYVGDVVKAGLPAIAGAGLFGPIAGSISSGLGATGAANTALTGALTGAATAGVTGGDPLTAAISGGLGGFADPLITGADLGTLGTAGAEGLSAAAIAELTGGDPLQAGLLAAGMSLGKDALEALKADDEITTPTGETIEEPSVVDKAKEAVEEVKDTVKTATDIPVSKDVTAAIDALSPVYETYDKIIEDVGSVSAFNKLSPSQLESYIIKHGGSTQYRQLFPYVGGARSKVDLPDEIVKLAGGVGNVPDFIMETTMEDFVRPPASRTETIVDVSELELPEERFEPERPVVPTPPGGGGGASSAAPAPSVPTPTVTAPTPPSATVTPVVQPPTLTSPGSVTNALLTNTLATLASTTAPTTAPQPTVAPPVTPVATTAPTPEPTPVTTTEPTDIFEDTTAEDTAAQIEAAETARDAAEAARDAAEAQAQADAAAAEARYEEAVAAGEALGEARYGEGLGTDRGQGAGAGLGAGLGLGLLAGMGSGMGGVGTGFTPKEFEDYEFRKTYVAPELVERTLPLQGYQAPVSLNLFRGFV